LWNKLRFVRAEKFSFCYYFQNLNRVLPMKKHRAKKIKIYHKIPKLSPVTSIISKIPTKNTIPDLIIKAWYQAIKGLKIFTVSSFLPPQARLSCNVTQNRRIG